MKLYVVRHGRTDWNVRRIMQGRVDTSLNMEGIEQAHETRELLKNYRFDRVFVSPQKRALQTAEIVTEGMSIPLIVAEALRERSYGEFEGQGRDVFDYVAFWDYGKDLHYREAENIRDFFDRVRVFLDMLRERFSDESILLVTHGGVIRAVECYVHPEKADETLGRWIPRNCSIYEYDL